MSFGFVHWQNLRIVKGCVTNLTAEAVESVKSVSLAFFPIIRNFSVIEDTRRNEPKQTPFFSWFRLSLPRFLLTDNIFITTWRRCFQIGDGHDDGCAGKWPEHWKVSDRIETYDVLKRNNVILTCMTCHVTITFYCHELKIHNDENEFTYFVIGCLTILSAAITCIYVMLGSQKIIYYRSVSDWLWVLRRKRINSDLIYNGHAKLAL